MVGKTKENTYDSDIAEKLRLAVQEGIANGLGTLNGENLQEALKNNGIFLDSRDFQKTGNGWVCDISNNTYLINANGSIKTDVWMMKDNIYVTNGRITFNVGMLLTGYSVNVNDKIYGDGSWYILGAENGNLLVTTNINTEMVELTGRDGYENGLIKLNKIAEKYINDDLSDGNARSINIDDINRVTGYDPSMYSKYGEIITYTSGTFYRNGKWERASEENPIEMASTVYGYSPKMLSATELAYKLLFFNTSGDELCYRLASTYTEGTTNLMGFGFHCIRDGEVKNDGRCVLF